MISGPVKVSVLMITYNHERYVKQAIDSVLAQRADFAYELVIGEDRSSDGTRAICKAFQREHPQTVRVLEREENLGAARNFLSTLAECSGEYLAILEGDDYWPSPLKLQKQAQYLDAHSDCALVFARTEAFFQDSDRRGYDIPRLSSEPFTLKSLLKGNYIATCSVMYRKDLVREYPSWLAELDLLDWPLHVLYAQNGEIGYIDETLAAYRIHTEGTFSRRRVADNCKSILEFFRLIGLHLGPEYATTIARSEAGQCKVLVRSALAERIWGDALRYAPLAVRFYVRSLMR